MPLYEHVFLARQDVSGQQVEALTEQFKGVIEQNGGKVTKVRQRIRRHLPLSQHAEGHPKVGASRSRGLGHGSGCLASLLGREIVAVLQSTGMNGHQAEVVRERVMQLTCDLGSFGLTGLSHPRLQHLALRVPKPEHRLMLPASDLGLLR